MKKSLLIIMLALVGLSNSAFAQSITLLNFTGANGSSPRGSLIFDGTFLYGMTPNGGTGIGNVFKIKPDGANYSQLLDFGGTANGANPFGSLISDGTFLYGMTNGNSNGQIFKIKPDGTGYTDILDFVSVNGANPYGSLISVGTFLYGMTALGGTNGAGIIFKKSSNNTGYLTLLNFMVTSDGSGPFGDLISDGTFLYGMASAGGTNSDGTLFKIKPDGTGYLKLLDFAGIANGASPDGSLISDGTFLYGMTEQGGANTDGTIFKIKPDGTSYAKLLDFAGIANGMNPHGSLISDGTFLYGMTKAGGSNNYGTVFKIKPDGTGYAKLMDFAGANGKYPYGSLISDGTFLYGMTEFGGANNLGVVFKLCLSPPVVTAITTANTVCAGTQITLTGSGADTYAWSNGITNGVSFVPPTGTTTYTVTGTITSTGCINIAMKTITVNPLPTATITANGATTFCQGDSVTLTATSGMSSYHWSTNATTQSITVSTSRNDSVTVTDANGCSKTSAITTVTVNPLPVTPTITQSGTVLTSSSITGNQWYLNGNTITGATSQTDTVTQNGNYTVVVTNGNGCSATSTPFNFNTTGINKLALNTIFTIYPNPFTSQTTITFNKEIKNVEIKIIDVLGKEVKRVNLTGNEYILEKGELKTGVYYLQIVSEKKIIAKEKVIILN